MSMATRRWRSLSAPRRLIVELMAACRGVPLVTAERRMDLSSLIEARHVAEVRPAWTVVIAKAFAVVAAKTPALRTSFISFPWPHLCEHSEPVVGIALEREFRGEEVVLFTQVRQPQTVSLTDLDAHLRHVKVAPVDSVRSFCRALDLARLPWPLRGWAMRMALHASGRWQWQT